MTTEYTHTATIAVPESMINGANHLAACLGGSLYDLQTYKAPTFTSGGVNYAVTAPAVTDSFLGKAQSGNLTRPDFDAETQQIDMTAAANALANTIIVARPAGEEEFVPVPAQPDKIVAYIDFDPAEAIELMGLSRIPPEESELE